MTYQGERARPLASERGRYFEVTKVRIGADGHVSDVLWGEIDAGSDRDVGERVLATASEVVDAIHDGAQVAGAFPSTSGARPERPFVIVAHGDGRECIAFADGFIPGRNLSDMENLDDVTVRPRDRRSRPTAAHGKSTFAVSKVRLDSDGRITAVQWGEVDTSKNAWAAPEVVAPVADVVAALNTGERVFALFPSVHGHMPDRQFAIADYDGGRKTVVLDGPSAYEREVHDMDRLSEPRRSRSTP